MPNFWRTRFVARSSSPTMFVPSIQISPLVGDSRATMRRRRVVLPAPEPPMMTVGLVLAALEVDALQDLLVTEVLADSAERDDDVLRGGPAGGCMARRA
jgi:hypothetical protein